MGVKKILIISNAALSQTDSNGRNIARLLDCFSIQQKAQFFVYGEPDFNECKDYYHISDKMAFLSLNRFKKIDGRVQESVKSIQNMARNKKHKKTPLKMIIRELIWKFGSWRNHYFNEWIDDIKPDCLLVVCGDNAFTLNIANIISIRRNIPVILYSTEEYPFKDYNYVTKRPSIFYNIWKRIIDKAYKRIENRVSVGVFNTNSLCELFDNRFSYKCCCIYQKTNIDWIEHSEIDNPKIVSYLGNLGLNRHKALIEIANSLAMVFPNLKLDVYGKMSKIVEQELLLCPNIRLCGFVEYNDVVKIIHNSTLLVHTEYDSEFFNRDLKYAFSTKISDSVSSGTPLLIYANQNLAESVFLRKHKCAFVATTKEELHLQIKQSLSDVASRRAILKEAYIARKEFFERDDMFKTIIEDIVYEKGTIRF
ncbi:MAG: Glycosyl transferases group 1 [Tenericutes bacterium ADurb.BinA124]|nr:MAG: Glycosyl transferases group 1 [Tenericutes bacterium ADurb.BinA124]